MTETAIAPASIAKMLRGYSLELNPTQTKILDAAVERLGRGTEVFLTWIPGANPMDTVAPASKLRRAGLIPVPHVGARHLENAEQLERFAARLAHDSGVDRVLIIAGDRAKPAGPYDSSLAVMRTGILQAAGIRRMAVAGFPEGHPNISEAVLDDALAAKLRFAQNAGVQLSVVTQFCFKAHPILEWLRRIRNRGIDIPVRVGLAGPAGLITLVRYAVRCGIGNSMHVLTEHPSFAKLLTEKGPEPIIRELAFSLCGENEDILLNIAGLHFYVFGSFSKTLDWLDAERAR